MEYLLFAGYLLLFSWLVTKVKFFTRTGLTQPQLIILFLLKVMAGILYGWIGIYYGNLAQMVDTWSFHYNSLQEYRLLHTDPYTYFTNLFQDPYPNGYLKFLSSDNSYWNDLKGNAFVKLLSLFNIFSFGYYYVNIIFYSFLSLYGPVAVYRVMMDVYPARKIPVLLATFLLPSFIYWTSGIHKDGLIFTGIALVVYNIYFGLQEQQFKPKRIAAIFLGLLIVVVLRNFLLVILIPAIIAWILANRFKNRGLLVYLLVYVIFCLFFFTAKYISPRLDFPDAVASKQADFMELKGGSEVPTTRLQPNFLSFLKNAPEAISLAAIRPYPSDVKHLLSLAAALEINLLTLVFIVFLFWRNNDSYNRPFLYFCLFFSFSVLLSIGYTVNFLGAIVRYRSLVFPFLFVPMFALFNWKKIEKLVA